VLLKRQFGKDVEMAQNRSVFVSGGGPVGLTAAVELARRGIAVQAIDPDMAPSPQSRALVINARSLDLLELSGVTERLLAAGHRLNHIIIRRNGKILGHLDLSVIQHRLNFVLALPQSETEAVLEKRLAELGSPLQRGKALTSFSGDGPIKITMQDGTTATAEYLLGADGAHSPVRKILGIGFPGEAQPEEFGLADVTLRDWPFPFDTMVATLTDHHLVAFVPLGEGFGRFITNVPNCLEHLPVDAIVSQVEWETNFKISFRQAETYQKGNVFLAGDAAHIHSPVGGRGMNLGMEDACWFAQLVSEGKIAAYSQLRHPAGARVLKLTNRFTSVVRSRGMLQHAILSMALPILSHVPSLQRKLFNNLTGLDTPPPTWL
jgi:2-polyprenyl-6-methoxyphenol hydroxylase-like FAD-dependent oxidoreductase